MLCRNERARDTSQGKEISSASMMRSRMELRVMLVSGNAPEVRMGKDRPKGIEAIGTHDTPTKAKS
jgi:hypothetical protein